MGRAAVVMYRAAVAEPTLDLAQAKRLMDALYEPGDSIYVCAHHDRNKLIWCQSRLTHDEGFSAGVFIGLEDRSPGTISASADEQKVVHNKWGFKEGHLKTKNGNVTVRRFAGDTPPTASTPGDYPQPNQEKPKS